MEFPLHLRLNDLDATNRFAAIVAAHVKEPMTIALSGTLGAGKTQWCRNFCTACGVPADMITSPTYVLIQHYHGKTRDIYHLDYYRLVSEEQVWDLGFDEMQEQPVVLLVEWADKFPETLPADHLKIHLITDGPGQLRTAEITATGRLSRDLVHRSGLASFNLAADEQQKANDSE